MKKKQIIFSILFVLLSLTTLFTRCTEDEKDLILIKDNPVPALHTSALPYYITVDKHTIDSVKSTKVKDNFAEMVYYKNGNLEAYYTDLNIRNITLRKNYQRFKAHFKSVVNYHSCYQKMKHSNYILFNGYLHYQGMPMLTLSDFESQIENKNPIKFFGKDPPRLSSILISIIIFMIVLFILGYLIYHQFFKWKPISRYDPDKHNT